MLQKGRKTNKRSHNKLKKEMINKERKKETNKLITLNKERNNKT